MTVTITPDARMQSLAQTALDVQDACNGTAVARLLRDTMSALLDYNQGTSWVNQHPITRVILNKLSHLAVMEQSKVVCFDQVHDLAAGKPVEFELREGF